jgi:hypothetical protein
MVAIEARAPPAHGGVVADLHVHSWGEARTLEVAMAGVQAQTAAADFCCGASQRFDRRAS